MSKVKNPSRRCRICGGKCEKVMRYCKLCAKERKAAKEAYRKEVKKIKIPHCKSKRNIV